MHLFRPMFKKILEVIHRVESYCNLCSATRKKYRGAKVGRRRFFYCHMKSIRSVTGQMFPRTDTSCVMKLIKPCSRVTLLQFIEINQNLCCPQGVNSIGPANNYSEYITKVAGTVASNKSLGPRGSTRTLPLLRFIIEN